MMIKRIALIALMVCGFAPVIFCGDEEPESFKNRMVRVGNLVTDKTIIFGGAAKNTAVNFGGFIKDKAKALGGAQNQVIYLGCQLDHYLLQKPSRVCCGNKFEDRPLTERAVSAGLLVVPCVAAYGVYKVRQLVNRDPGAVLKDWLKNIDAKINALKKVQQTAGKKIEALEAKKDAVLKALNQK